MSDIKICGLKRQEDVCAVNEYHPDFVGFVFANTKRFVSDETAAELKKALDPSIQAVGVFVKEPIGHVVKLAADKTIDVIQLHGDEELDYVNQLREELTQKIGSQKRGSATRVPVIKVVRMDAVIDDLGQERARILQKNVKLIENARQCEPDYLLFDTKVKGIPGGSGQTFDLSGLPPDDQIGLPYFLAGGIDLTNVQDLIKLRRPFGIDVSSAVETEGLKDAGKIRAMIAKVREIRETIQKNRKETI